MKKHISISVLAVFLMLSILLMGCVSQETPEAQSSATQQPSAPQETIAPTAEDQPTIRILAEITGGRDPDEHTLWQQEFSEKSGISIEMTSIPGDDYATKLSAILASGGSGYDIVYMRAATYKKLASSGLFEPLFYRKG